MTQPVDHARASRDVSPGWRGVAARLAAGGLDDAGVLASARELVRLGATSEDVRSVWPTDQLPVLEPYFCNERLGQGAAGVVFKALRYTEHPRLVALKVLQFSSGEAEERFRQREIEILKALRCAHVSRYLDSGQRGGTVFLAMELVDGRPLDRFLQESTSTMEERLDVFRRACQVIGAIHAAGVVHRDLKPKHILVDRRGAPWIVDFGLSAVQTEDWPTRVRAAQTELGRILGTVKYMSPQQAWGGLMGIDYRTDLWALGVMLYEIATEGDYPYSLEPVGDLTGHDALLHRIQAEAPRRPHITGVPYGDALATLVSRCLAYEPERRIESADVLAEDLGRLLSRRPIRTRNLPLSYRLQRIGVGLATHRRTGLWLATVSTILLLLLAWAQVWGVRSRASAEDFGAETRRVLAAAARGTDSPVLVAAIGDETVTRMLPRAASLGLKPVTEDIRTWRAAHGLLMGRLASTRPRAVIWDFMFLTPGPDDGAFAAGIGALEEAGVPVVLAIDRFEPDGTPHISPGLLEAAKSSGRVGLPLARDMVARPGSVVLAVRRSEEVYPALVLAAFSAVVHPDCRTTLSWDGRSKTVRIVYHPRSAEARPPGLDPIGLTTIVPDVPPARGVNAGDILACKAFELQRPQAWEAHTVDYLDLLLADDEELERRTRGKVLILGDLRRPRFLAPRDRHVVRYGTTVVDDVPGSYILADALCGLLANRYLRSEGVLTPATYVLVAVLALLVCMATPRLGVSAAESSPGVRRAVIASLVLLTVLGLVLVPFFRARMIVQLLLCTTAIALAMIAALKIEWVRRRRKGPSMIGATSSAHGSVMPA
jgi:predicted Ser/Thr protein kinase